MLPLVPPDDVFFSATIPGRFHPGWSLLGRALRRRCADRLRAEALFLVVLTGGALGCLLAHYVAWAFVGETVTQHPAGPTALLFYGASVGSLLLVVGGGLVGFEPPARVRCTARGLHVRKGRQRVRVPCARITRVDEVPAQRYHRHYRRYAAVRPFVGRPSGPVLLLHTDGPEVVALGLAAADRAALRRRLAAPRAAPAGVQAARS